MIQIQCLDFVVFAQSDSDAMQLLSGGPAQMSAADNSMYWPAERSPNIFQGVQKAGMTTPQNKNQALRCIQDQ